MMILNPDCIRDVLITVNELIVPNDFGNAQEITTEELCSNSNLSEYQQSELIYTVKHLFDDGMLKKGKIYVSDTTHRIADITTKGQQFVTATESPTVWEKTKSGLQTAVIKGLEISATALYNIAITHVLS